eukprot:CAMPEP_0177301482 /NCGR_PEP_ID=MMETSP0368-20130122/5086_1 /TAXON_ID=447022 ORGANISM="Scrippsiella hangoei-like, Strain SHHI-4" /NCGR_SAMPLE_ID=MMETSP0368 /ASSEMBLY_ACC=CAM_ASM_000363 /LENGTH=60 /DNA_ID=CAMNT_0018759891 /DNA_START=161 /DNA_END=339 /DNA_ORIENTATION=-
MSDTAITATAILEGGEVLESWWARLAVVEDNCRRALTADAQTAAELALDAWGHQLMHGLG